MNQIYDIRSEFTFFYSQTCYEFKKTIDKRKLHPFNLCQFRVLGKSCIDNFSFSYNLNSIALVTHLINGNIWRK